MSVDPLSQVSVEQEIMRTASLLAAQEAGRSYRARIDALRTLAANQRAAITYSEGMGG